MYSVLVPVDRDENRSLHQAKYVGSLSASTEELEATVLYVVPPARFRQAEEVSFSSVEAAVGAADHLEQAGISVNRVVEDGSPTEEIVRTAKELDSDEIVVGGRKRSGVTQALLGSTVLDVFLSTDRPVTITGRGMVFGGDRRRVLVPVDEDTERARHQAEYVAGLPGATENVEATVLYVFAHLDYEGAPPHEFQEIDAAVEAADHLEDRGIPVERIAVGDEVSRRILEEAENRDVSSIVVGGRKRSGVQKVLLGSTTQDVMLSAERPVTLTG